MNSRLVFIFFVTAVILFSLGYIFDRWLNPWLANRTVKKLLCDIKKGKPQKPRNYDFEITFDSNNISVRPLKYKSTEQVSVTWMKIKRATAFKRDLFTVDCICLLFETVDQMTLELNEDMKGWNALTESMPNHLPGCKPLSDWIFQVATPAFETNPTEIFSRS